MYALCDFGTLVHKYAIHLPPPAPPGRGDTQHIAREREMSAREDVSYFICLRVASNLRTVFLRAFR